MGLGEAVEHFSPVQVLPGSGHDDFPHHLLAGPAGCVLGGGQGELLWYRCLMETRGMVLSVEFP